MLHIKFEETWIMKTGEKSSALLARKRLNLEESVSRQKGNTIFLQ